MRLKKERLKQIRDTNNQVRKFHHLKTTYVTELLNEIDALNKDVELLKHTQRLIEECVRSVDDIVEVA